MLINDVINGKYLQHTIKILITLFTTMLISFSSYCQECKFSADDMFRDVIINGKISKFLNFDNLDICIAEVATYAKNYPPHFENSSERIVIEKKLDKLIKIFELLDDKTRKDQVYTEFLRRYGSVLAMSYNLDFPNSYSNTIEVFERIIAIDPEDINTNLLYGTFLAGSIFNDSAIKYLKKANDKGSLEAKFRLADFYARNKDTQPQAIKLYEEYLKIISKDQGAYHSFQAIKGGNVFIQNRLNGQNAPITKLK